MRTPPANAKKFTPGHSGNPKGRPSIPFDVREMARAHTTTAIATLVHWARKRSSPAAVRAAEILLDRGWGKATQTLDIAATITLERLIAASLVTGADEPERAEISNTIQ